MKKKQFMSKLAALTMAAMMGLSAVPATTVNVMAAVITETGAAATVGEDDKDVKAAKDAVSAKPINLSGATNESSAETAIGSSITAAINGQPVAATVTVDSFTASSSEKKGSLSGTAIWTVDGTAKPNAGDSWYDITVTVPFTASWADANKASVTLAAETASGSKTTYTNYDDESAVNKADYVTVTKADASAKASTAAAIKTALATAKGGNYIIGAKYWNDTAKTWQSGQSAATAKADIDAFLSSAVAGSTYVVDKDSVKFTDSKNFTFNVFNTADPSEVYNVTIAVEAVKMPEEVKTTLDNFFNVHTFKISKGQTITNGTVASAVTTAQKAASDTDDEWQPDTLATDKVTVYGNTTALTVADGKASGKLSVTVKAPNYGLTADKTFDYAFTANVDQSDSTLSETEAAAIAKINATTYPSYNSAVTDHDLPALEAKIEKDLKDAGYTKTVNWSASESDYDTATKTSDGYLKAAIGSLNAINVKLAYSSDQKSDDTNKSLLNVLKGKNDDANGEKVTEHKTVAAGGQTSDPDDTVELKKGNDYTINIAANSKLSTTVQATTATKEATKAEVVAAVQKAIDDQLTADGVKDNGVSVTVKAVNKYDLKNSAVVDGHTKPADTSHGGTWTLLVTTSIANDFNGYGNDKAAKKEVNYLLTLDTNKLKKSDAKGISLADKTVNITRSYAAAANTEAKDCTYTYVVVKPTLTPADSNTPVTYKIVDSDGNVIKSGVAAKSIVNVDTGSNMDLYAAKSSDKVSVSDNALGLAVTKTGTFKVTATAGSYSATATVTVNSNFKDVPSTAFYADAVSKAYARNVTTGVTEDTFAPNATTTRGQFITWLYREAVAQNPSVAIKDGDVKSIFTDVPATSFCAKAVQWAYENGITTGTTSTTFSPDQNITRAQAVTLLWRMEGRPDSGAKGSTEDPTLKFTDVDANGFYIQALTWAVNNRITSGTSTTTFNPNDDCTRGQGVTFIGRAFWGVKLA